MKKSNKKPIRQVIKIYRKQIDYILLTPDEFENEMSLRMSFIRQGINFPIPA